MTKPVFSVIVPAYNEEELIAACLMAVNKAISLCGEPGELIVVDNNSTDQTASIALKHGAKVVFAKKRQIARARNAGAQHAAGEYLFFVDADTLISAELFSESLRLLKTKRCIGGGALPEFDREVGFMAKALLRFWKLISRSFHLAAGCFLFCRAAAFFAVGGFNEAVYASEDVQISVSLKKRGRKTGMHFKIIDKPWLHTSARKNSDSLKLLLTILLFWLFPAAVRYRTLCFFWYTCRSKSMD